MSKTGGACGGGFTIIELMVTIALAAVLMTLAAPSFVQYQRNAELTSVTNSLLAAISTARSEAMKTGRNAYLMPLESTGWGSGWVVFVDTNPDANNPAAVYSQTGDVTVQTQDAQGLKNFDITGTDTAAPVADPGRPYIRFDSSGYASKKDGAPTSATLSIARAGAAAARPLEQTRRIIVARTGRVRSCKPQTDTACTITATQ